MMYVFIKRIIDVFISICFIIVFSPVYILFTVAIWLQDKHSPFYTQDRIGLHKKVFKLYKFRSMVIDADDILFSDKKLYKAMRSGINKVKNDPRVTKIGKFIRKYSIDEFPQIINVLKGDMSFVGPRALRPDEYKLYESKSDEKKDKLVVLVSVKPGITGYWQVNGRSKIGFDERIDMECFYAKNLSFWLDFVIIMKTPWVVIKGEGAC